MNQQGKVIAGRTAAKELGIAEILAEKYGGEPEDWVKISSYEYEASDGTKFQTHWYRNIKTNQQEEFKTKFV